MTTSPLRPSRLLCVLFVPFVTYSLSIATAQTPAPEPPATPPQGKVLFSRTLPSDSTDAPDQGPVAPISTSAPSLPAGPPDAQPATPITRAERSSLLITSYDLDVHLIPANSALETHATLTLRNLTSAALPRIPLQISSTLRWQTVSEVTLSGLKTIPFTQSPIATDTDHSGYAQEAVLTLPKPLPPGATLTLSVFYQGSIPQSAARLELLGTHSDRADQADWDQIAPTADDSATALRGFGNVLWYPVAAPIALLGDGNALFDLVNRQRLAGSSATIRLRLAVDYVGDPPVAAIFNARSHPLTAVPDGQDQLISQTHGVATTDFPSETLGFRFPSLFLTAEQPIVTPSQALAVITPPTEAVSPYADAAALVQPLLADWFGVNPIQPLTLLDHAGDPFEDDALVVAPLKPDARPGSLAPGLIGPLTHAWLRSSHPWIADGLADFLQLLWNERGKGRDEAVSELQEQTTSLALAEPDLAPYLTAGKSPPDDLGEPLTRAYSPVYFRTKAAAVWWQLRDILGEDILRQALVAYRHSETLNPSFDADPKAMQETLERLSAKDLAWFFDDWVYHDRSLPDLDIVEVNPHPLPERLGRSDGYLVAVEVRNEGDAAAEVPVTVRSGSLSATERLRIPARSLASTRIVFNGVPESVEVNDGSTPELRSSTHTRQIEIHHE
jgi:hypothetical protein